MPPSTPPRKKHGKYTTRDQRRNIKIVYQCGKQIPNIVAILNIIAKRVTYALNNKALTPKKQTRQPPKLNAEQRQQLVDYVYSSRKT
jgi:transposase